MPNDQQMAMLQQQLIQLGLLAGDKESAAQLVHQTVTKALNDSRGQWILKAHQEARSELALTALIDNQVENLVIDRTFIDENGIRWIIDYKTASAGEKDLNAFLDKEQEKYSKQMQKYYQAMQLREER